MTRKTFFLFSIITSFIFSLSLLTYSSFRSSKPLLSPLSSLLAPANSLNNPHLTSQKAVYGFLPYWNLKEVNNLHYPLITHLAYFGVDYDTNGRILTRLEDRTAEPGFRRLNSESVSHVLRLSKASGNKTILVLRAMTNEIIENIVNAPAKRQTAIQQTLDLAVSKNFDGLNIDFEYVGTPSTQTKNNFSTFVKDLSISCKQKIKGCIVSIDVYADSARDSLSTGRSDRIWNYASLNPYLDHIIIMAYDFFRPSSTQAGPVAPLRGSCTKNSANQSNCLDYDISQSVTDFSRILPANKIILGVPFYGYQWQTAGSSFLANTYEDTGRLASYKRIQEILNNRSKVLGIQSLWDNHTLTPRIVLENKGITEQIYYDDNRSLSLKYDLVNQSGLGGIAIWALGYEGDAKSPWQLIQAKFFNSTLTK